MDSIASPPEKVLVAVVLVAVSAEAVRRSPMFAVVWKKTGPVDSNAPEVVVALPMPMPPVRYAFPVRERVWVGLEVPMPMLPVPSIQRVGVEVP